jgi:CRP-like cAMP-binding protein
MNEPSAEAVPDCFRGPDTQPLLDAGQMRTMPALTALCEEGQVTDCFFLVTAGEFEIAKRIAGRQCALSTSGPGSVLALMPALDGAPCSVSMRALNDATVVEIKRDSLLAMLDHGGTPNLKVANRLSLLAIRRLRDATDELAQALYCALRSTDRKGHIDAARLARIQAGSYAWLGD